MDVLEETALQSPAEGEWSVKETYAHIVDADVGFYVCVRYALERKRAGEDQPAKIPHEAWNAFIGFDEATFDRIMSGPFLELRNFHRDWHMRLIKEFEGIREDELSAHSMYWEGYPMPLRFRLHRFESHMRQHTIQIDGIQAALDRAPSETQRLLRLIYNALGEVEGEAIGAWDVRAAQLQEAAGSIDDLAHQVAALLNPSP